mmetsp:Transcript_71779/g.233330  ORF Transcript_71779/g.233330 Transcript_71779/m.233330 type:complete len:217 (-) Transcript_71779:76-726(-)
MVAAVGWAAVVLLSRVGASGSEAPGCEFTSGVAICDSWKEVGTASSYTECVRMVRSQEPMANGASVKQGGEGTCCADFGRTGTKTHEGWETCKLPEQVGRYSLNVTATCNEKDGVYDYAGLTASGAPWFEKVGCGLYIYYEPDCDGNGTFSQMWVIDDDLPSSTGVKDLDGDRDCKGSGFYDYASSLDRPPTSGIWALWCNSTWTMTYVSLEAQVS